HAFPRSGPCHTNGLSWTQPLHGTLRPRICEGSLLDRDTSRSAGISAGHAFCHVAVSPLLGGGCGVILGRIKPVLGEARRIGPLLLLRDPSMEGPKYIGTCTQRVVYRDDQERCFT